MYEDQEFPDRFIPLFKELNLTRKYLSAPYGDGKNLNYLMIILLELARIDASVATMYVVQNCLVMNTLDRFGS